MASVEIVVVDDILLLLVVSDYFGSAVKTKIVDYYFFSLSYLVGSASVRAVGGVPASPASVVVVVGAWVPVLLPVRIVVPAIGHDRFHSSCGDN